MKKKRKFSMLMPILLGLTAAVLAAALASLLAYGIVSEFVTRNLAEVLVPALIATSVFAMSFVAAKSVDAQGRGVAALCCSGVYFLTCVLAKLIFFPGNTQYLLRNFAVCTIAAVAAVLVSGVGYSRRKNIRARKRR